MTESNSENSSVQPIPGGQRLSASGKVWRIPSEAQLSAEFLEACGSSELIAKLLTARGIDTVSAAREFLDLSSYVPTDPRELPDVDKAVDRITAAIAKQEKITVYGDYDVDGVTGTSVLLSVLKKLGANVDFYIPNRSSEGYGLNLKAVSILASKHRTKLIVTCDCGVSNFAEVNFAKGFGVDTLILDHHSMPDLLPPAVGIVHPKRLDENHPLFHLPGVGVAYKVCEALLVGAGRESEVAELLDFVTLGMIADMVPLIRENRYLVRVGLPKLVDSQRPGIMALLAQVRKSDDTDLVGFGLAPKINAVGRLADAKSAVELMTTEDPAVAEQLAKELQSENLRRQDLCERIFVEADLQVQRKIDLDRDKAIAIYSEGWHHGVVGIVASRLVEKYHRPVFIAELEPNEKIIKGSARGVDAIDLYEILKANDHLLVKWGGHKMAAGFSTDAGRADALCRALIDTCTRALMEHTLHPALDVDMQIEAERVTLDLVESLSVMAPFGMWNKKPVFAVSKMRCSSTRALGKENKHHRIMVEDAEATTTFECVMWNTRGRVPADGQVIDIAFSPELNSYNGRDRLQLVLNDWRDSYKSHQDTARVTAKEAVVEKKGGPGRLLEEKERLVGLSRSEESAKAAAALPAVSDSQVLTLKERLNRSQAPSMESFKVAWKDLRMHAGNVDMLQRAIAKFGLTLSVFNETAPKSSNIDFCDRTQIQKCEHLLLWQSPANMQVFQDLLTKSGAETVYLMYSDAVDNEEASGFLKKLMGLVRYAANKMDGQVAGEKIAAVMGASKMSIALGLGLLRKINMIDWFSEDGILFLDLTGPANGAAEEHPEFKQLARSLQETREFRTWCASQPLKDIQCAVVPNQVQVPARAEESEIGPDMRDEEQDDYGESEQIGKRRLPSS